MISLNEKTYSRNHYKLYFWLTCKYLTLYYISYALSRIPMRTTFCGYICDEKWNKSFSLSRGQFTICYFEKFLILYQLKKLEKCWKNNRKPSATSKSFLVALLVRIWKSTWKGILLAFSDKFCGKLCIKTLKNN